MTTTRARWRKIHVHMLSQLRAGPYTSPAAQVNARCGFVSVRIDGGRRAVGAACIAAR